MRVSRIFIVLLFAGTLAAQLLGIRSSELQAKGLAKLKSAKWHKITSATGGFPINAEYVFSDGNKTITIDLPRKSDITFDYTLVAKLIYDSRDGDEVKTITVSKSAKLVKPLTRVAGSTVPKGKSRTSINFNFKLVAGVMKNINSNMTAEVEFHDPGSRGIEILKIVFRPHSNEGNYISHINSPEFVHQGDGIEFEVHLENPAASGGVTFFWKMFPAEDFDVSGSNSVLGTGSNSSLQKSFIPKGDTLTRFSVKVKLDASIGAGRKIETWVENTNTTQKPYYKTKSFSVRQTKE